MRLILLVMVATTIYYFVGGRGPRSEAPQAAPDAAPVTTR